MCLSSLTKVWIQRHRWVEREFRRLLYQFSDSFIWTKIHIDEEHNRTSSDRTIYRRSLRVSKRIFEPKTKHRKHWVLGNLVDFVNTKYRKDHRPPSDEIVVIHQTSISQQTQLSELIEKGHRLIRSNQKVSFHKPNDIYKFHTT